MDVLTLYRQ